ncbi:MAG: hypothetical protein HC905_18145 [Bacteroidales bacterium]|nr:hypothetical protein [Bacteroidales bacterium]
MSLPVFEAIGFQKILDKGGHSKPWVVLIKISDSLKPYVVKLYKTTDIEARNKMTAEVMGNLLAREFELNSANAAIINFSPEFRMKLNAACEEVLSVVDERPKFGSEFIEGSLMFNPQTDRQTIHNIIDAPLLYAFDYFLCNRDRNNNKPNLLVKRNEGILIDHEMGLEIDRGTIDNLLKEIWDSRYQYHLFYNYLKETRGNKNNLFDEFLFYLNTLKFTKFDTYFEQLESLGFNTQKEIIKEYWLTVQQNSSKFETILKRSIQ